MTFTLNFAQETWPEPGPTLADLVAAHRWTRSLVAVTINGRPVESGRLDEVRAAEGDIIQAFFLVSGG
jgi:sulfur carrier protein ThiS